MQVVDKKEAHELIDRMPAEEMPAVVEWLRSRIEDVDDEPVTEQDLQRLREMRAALDRGEEGTPMEEFLAEFGWTMDDISSK